MDTLARESRRGVTLIRAECSCIKSKNHKQAWPFLKPVDKDEIPDYYETVKAPMDLSAMEERLEHRCYTTLKLFIDDLKLVSSNCKLYNDATTVYAKCAVKLEKYMWTLARDIPEWVELLEEE
jgi:histone acetyltransferase